MNPKWKIKQLYTGAGIYQFSCNITGMKYVGSSKECKKRHSEHIAPSSRWSSKSIITAGDFEYDILEKLTIDVTDELLVDREQYWMDQVPSEFLLNINRAKRLGYKAYRASRRDEIKNYCATYRAEHKEKIAAQRAAYRAEHKDEFKAYYAAYHAANKEKIAAQQAARYAAKKLLKSEE
jgi:group I intron endonuclease